MGRASRWRCGAVRGGGACYRKKAKGDARGCSLSVGAEESRSVGGDTGRGRGEDRDEGDGEIHRNDGVANGIRIS